MIPTDRIAGEKSHLLPGVSQGPRPLSTRELEEHVMKSRQWIGSVLLVGAVIVAGVLLSAWKRSSIAEADATAANQPEPAEAVVTAVVREHEHVRTTTAIGTVVALRSIT